VVYANKKDWDRAFSYFEKSLAVTGGTSTPFELGVVHVEFGKALLASGNAPRARKELEEARKLFSGCDAERWMKEVEDLLSGLRSSKH
jgi:tetratricopeptide (TPR) repeat protein